MDKAIKTTWGDVKHEVKSLNPKLVEIFDEIGLDDEVLYEVYYPYGMTIADEQFFYMPDEQGELKKIPSDQYPQMILMDKCLELFLETDTRIVPNILYVPGNFMPMTVDVSPHQVKTKPKSPFRLVSGARSVSLMPLSASSNAFYNFKSKHGFKTSDENINDQFEVFKTVTDNIQAKWRSRLYVFDIGFRQKIRTEERFKPLLMFMYEQTLSLNAFSRNSMYFDYALTEILTSRNINIRPFSTEIIKQIILIALGAGIGFRPIVDENLFPLAELTQEILTAYGPTTTPIFIGPTFSESLGTDINYLPIPYFQHSLNDPKKFRPVFYLHEVQRYLPTILEDFTRHKLTENSIYAELIDILQLKFYTERGNDDLDILPVKDLTKSDQRFRKLEAKYLEPCRFGVCSKAPFSKALISIQLLRN